LRRRTFVDERVSVSELAEFARELHEQFSGGVERPLEAVAYPSTGEMLTDIRAVIFDVYGTLINYWREEMKDETGRRNLFIDACGKVAALFGFTDFLAAINPEAPPENTLYDLYCGLIALRREKAHQPGITNREIKIEEVWNIILLMLKRHGFRPDLAPGVQEDLSRRLAYAYNFFSLGRRLYPGVTEALSGLRDASIDLGIVSNAQFYTPIDLTLLIRDQSEGIYEDFNELFDPDLTIFSFEWGAVKPDVLLFSKLYDALYERNILPQQTVFAGNDLVLDVEPAAAAGMKTAFFTGDSRSVYFHDREGVILPDIVFSSFDELCRKISFHSAAMG
jgi:putative hydrolase of the HAD superfamily